MLTDIIKSQLKDFIDDLKATPSSDLSAQKDLLHSISSKLWFSADDRQQELLT
jgi:hypothetical protein